MELQVGVKVFLQNPEGKYLLVHRNIEKYTHMTSGLWDIVGGRIECGASLVENLKREVEEETTLTITSALELLDAQDIFVGKEKHVVRLTYRALTEGEVQLDATENDAYVWCTREELGLQDDLDVYAKAVLINSFEMLS